MKNYYFLLCLIGLLVLVGCQQTPTSPPSKESRNINFIDIAEYCNPVRDINVSADKGSYCDSVAGEDTLTYYSDEYNWSMMCCNLSNECLEDTSSEYKNICDPEGTQMSTYVFNDQGFWLAQCCDTTGGNCYIDKNVNPDNESTICDRDFSNSYGVNYTGTQWEGKCCVGGNKK